MKRIQQLFLAFAIMGLVYGCKTEQKSVEHTQKDQKTDLVSTPNYFLIIQDTDTFKVNRHGDFLFGDDYLQDTVTLLQILKATYNIDLSPQSDSLHIKLRNLIEQKSTSQFVVFKDKNQYMLALKKDTFNIDRFKVDSLSNESVVIFENLELKAKDKTTTIKQIKHSAEKTVAYSVKEYRKMK
ncbi:hypothetical protein [Bacteroides sp. 519]|uniref:hypothetical protein n=1 Tax=Bacteroides sp. 519 TaxID=2302937 RepID=UPI0013D60459|nr:hypothetical protein [Bacteroides sp. 519]NDV59780.1 hypothetical protein [Bacteroides sp. 519]